MKYMGILIGLLLAHVVTLQSGHLNWQDVKIAVWWQGTTLGLVALVSWAASDRPYTDFERMRRFAARVLARLRERQA